MYISFSVKVKCLLPVIDITQDFKIQVLLNCGVSELCAVCYTIYHITANSRCPTTSQDQTNGCEALYVNLLTSDAEGWIVGLVFFLINTGSALFLELLHVASVKCTFFGFTEVFLRNQFSALYITKMVQKNLKMNEDQRKTKVLFFPDCTAFPALCVTTDYNKSGRTQIHMASKVPKLWI